MHRKILLNVFVFRRLCEFKSSGAKLNFFMKSENCGARFVNQFCTILTKSSIPQWQEILKKKRSTSIDKSIKYAKIISKETKS